MGTMVEFAIVLFIRQRYDDQIRFSSFNSGNSVMEKSGKTKPSYYAGHLIDEESFRRRKKVAVEDTKVVDLGHKAFILTRKIDRASIVLFTTTYIIFNIIYAID